MEIHNPKTRFLDVSANGQRSALDCHFHGVNDKTWWNTIGCMDSPIFKQCKVSTYCTSMRYVCMCAIDGWSIEMSSCHFGLRGKTPAWLWTVWLPKLLLRQWETNVCDREDKDFTGHGFRTEWTDIDWYSLRNHVQSQHSPSLSSSWPYFSTFCRRTSEIQAHLQPRTNRSYAAASLGPKAPLPAAHMKCI